MTLVAIEAAHSSRCGIGDHTIRSGDLIVEIDGEWCCAECAEEDGHDVDDQVGER